MVQRDVRRLKRRLDVATDPLGLRRDEGEMLRRHMANVEFERRRERTNQRH
jgi:hypothetical protein